MMKRSLACANLQDLVDSAKVNAHDMRNAGEKKRRYSCIRELHFDELDPIAESDDDILDKSSLEVLRIMDLKAMLFPLDKKASFDGEMMRTFDFADGIVKAKALKKTHPSPTFKRRAPDALTAY